MEEEPSRGSIRCQMDEWKTCVLCGELDKKAQMRFVTNACHLHLIVAYLKFSGTVPMGKMFNTYDQNKFFEAYMCSQHIDLPAKALRNIYAFPPEAPLIRGKCNPQGLIRVLRKYLPSEYHDFTIYDLAMAIPDSKVPLTRETRERTCCQLLQDTQRRLNVVLENVEHTPSSANLNFALFQELIDIKNSLNVEVQESSVIVELVDDRPGELAALRRCEKFLIDFEKVQRDQIEAERYPTPPMPARSGSPLQVLLTSPNISPHFRKRKQPLILGKQPRNRCDPPPQDAVRAILNCKLVLFSIDDLRTRLPGIEPSSLRAALTHLESIGLLFSHIMSSELLVIHLKELRRHKLDGLWDFGIIPEHYRQRLIGSEGAPDVREQVRKHGQALLEMEAETDMREAIEAVESVIWNVGGARDNRIRAPRMEMLDCLQTGF